MEPPPGAAYGQVAALRRESRGLIAVSRHVQLVGDTPGKPACKLGTLLERNARNGDQGQHIGGTHAGMRPLVVAHVDHLGGLLHSGESGFQHRLGFADEGDHRTVGRLARIHVEQLDAARRLDCVGDLLDDCLVASLAEIGDALYDTFFHLVRYVLSRSVVSGRSPDRGRA